MMFHVKYGRKTSIFVSYGTNVTFYAYIVLTANLSFFGTYQYGSK